MSTTIAKWLTRGWWAYLLAPHRDSDVPRRTVIWCRLRGHPAGEIFYNSAGFEPDHRCANCPENLG